MPPSYDQRDITFFVLFNYIVQVVDSARNAASKLEGFRSLEQPFNWPSLGRDHHWGGRSEGTKLEYRRLTVSRLTLAKWVTCARTKALNSSSSCTPASSMASEPPTDIDFWEFVSCAKCHLPYASEFGKSVPFWLTECGHIICNNHLSPCLCILLNFESFCDWTLDPDQICASCGSTGILVVALQQEVLGMQPILLTSWPMLHTHLQLDAPMSDWFKPIPSALDSVVFAAKVRGS